VKKERAIYLVAGEPSGDFIGSETISEFLKLYPDMTIHGVGGHFMEKFRNSLASNEITGWLSSNKIYSPFFFHF
jgi:lipid A disaccharide synthetase